ncbi:Flp pilus assembly protein CpaB [Robiginitomaculum antarcticum]|uniref:Flp pilus assembly protein CpaB n=1 Tax=Robiginitomaculum antarcticum TaxID=437507 RepID=UPI0003A4B035|nr:Flp pilus assembly protein CpaB [Robiginitomaculum antarcticum]
MRINTIVTLGASAAFGILAILLAKGWINDAVHSEFASNKNAPGSIAKPQSRTVPVFVANADLNFGDTLTPESLRLVDMPEDAVPLGTFSEHDSIFGDGKERTVVLTRIGINEPLINYKISGPGGRGSLSAIIDEDMRAVSIRTNDVAGVSGFILPGDHVDIMLTRDLAIQGEERRMGTDVLLQNIRVLGTGQNSDQTGDGVNVVKTVTLEVSPVQAQKLTLAMDLGSLSLTLRRVGTLDIDPVSIVEEKALAHNAAAPAARRIPRKTYPVDRQNKIPPTPQKATVTIIRGEDRDTVSVLKDESPQPGNDSLAGRSTASDTQG